MSELGILTARLDSHPPDWIAFGVGDQTGDDLRIYYGLLNLSVALAFVFAEGFSAQFPMHAPTSAAGSVVAEEHFKITPELLGKGVKG